MNEIEVIDNVRGEWRTVTKPSEVTVGQRVRYAAGEAKFGFPDCKYKSDTCRFVGENKTVFGCDFDYIQAFFPLPVKRKVANVQADRFMDCDGHLACKIDMVVNNQPISLGVFSSRHTAIRGARRFCAAIGYECEIVK